MDAREVMSGEEVRALREPDGEAPAVAADGRVVDLHADHWERIAAGRLPALESVGERMSSLLKTTARRFFRQPVEVVQKPWREHRWGAWSRRLPVPVSLSVLELRTLKLRGVVCLDAEFVFVLVDVFFGGDGRGDRPETSADFSPMEVRLVRKFIAAVIEDMKEAWKPFADLGLQAGTSESNPVLASVGASSDRIFVTSFGLAFGRRELSLDIVLPAAVVESVRHLQEARPAEGGREDPRRWKKRLQDEMQDARVALRAVLGCTDISLRDLTVAKPGDIIPTDIPATLVLYAGETPLLEGTFGTHQGRNAVRITRPANRATVGEKYGSIDDT